MTNEEYKETRKLAQKENPVIFGYGYASAINDITEKLINLPKGQINISMVELAKLLLEFNKKMQVETIEKGFK